jgi:hypothetical protein
MLSGIIFPDTVSAISVVAAFGLLFPFILVVLGLIKRLASSGG